MVRSTMYALSALLVLLTITSEAAVSRFPPFEQLQRLEQPNLRAEPRAEVLNYRLPNTTAPTNYAVELTTNVHSGDTAFEGSVAIDLQIFEQTNEIVIHARQLDNFVATIIRTDQTGQTAITLTTHYNDTLEFLTLKPTDEAVVFEVDSTWNLKITYNGTLRSDNGGFYLSSFTDENGATKYLATTQFESTDARHAFPCYDEPAKRATFEITIKHDPSYNAISNMPVNAAKSSSGVTAFDKTEKMSTYLVAFIVSDFVYTEGELNGLPQRVYSRKGTEAEQEWALTTGMLVEKRLSEYLGVPFALPKLDQAAIPDFAAGAMENWGLATYREEYLLYNPEKSTINTQTNIATIESHEDGHMWFGDLVAIEWWSYLWLKEGFATLLENLAVDLAYPEWNIFQLFHAGSYQSAMLNDAVGSIRPMTHYVDSPAQIGQLYDSVAYAKAGSVLDMWRHALTNKVFQRGLNNYLTAKQYSAANEQDLFDAIALAAKEENYAVPETVNNMMISWTRQAGVPLLTVERNYEDGSFKVKQERYLNNDASPQTWYVPINYATLSNPDFRSTEATHYLLNETELVVKEVGLHRDGWLVLNKQSTGYYRINYDERNWQLISEELSYRHYKIHPRNRAQFISDLTRLSASKLAAHSTLLTLLTYLPQEDQYAPWAAANTVITLYTRYLNGDTDFHNFNYYVRDLVRKQFDIFGVNDLSGEQHLVKYTRNVLINLACLAGEESCLTETTAKLQQLIDNGTEIEPNLQAQIYCNGLKQSKSSVFNFVYDKLMDSNDQAERRLLISSLGCSLNAEDLKKFVSSSIDDTNQLRTQERPTLLSSAYSRGEVGLLTSIEFLDEHWEAYGKLNAGFGGVNPLYTDIAGMSAYVVNEAQKAKLQVVVDKVKTSEFVPDTLQQTVDSNINANFQWLEANRQPIMSWVEAYQLKNGASTALSTSFAALFLAICLLAARLF